ncbi:hypothetical protein ANN_27874 [Periplaneta americana]|uniref:Uncharacterized protein n=1 Tax=Periplaneta americana TaxID=6978 RepID=A0ABQ8RVH7_PERAM|nr:hypothetical protein ANN_27874 [Periplaneta americana]
MSPGSSAESYPVFAHIGLRENPGKNLNQVTCPDRESNPDHLVSRPDAQTVSPQEENLLNFHSTEIKKECEDYTCDVIPEIEVAETVVPIILSKVKCEAERGRPLCNRCWVVSLPQYLCQDSFHESTSKGVSTPGKSVGMDPVLLGHFGGMNLERGGVGLGVVESRTYERTAGPKDHQRTVGARSYQRMAGARGYQWSVRSKTYHEACVVFIPEDASNRTTSDTHTHKVSSAGVQETSGISLTGQNHWS